MKESGGAFVEIIFNADIIPQEKNHIISFGKFFSIDTIFIHSLKSFNLTYISNLYYKYDKHNEKRHLVAKNFTFRGLRIIIGMKTEHIH